MASKANSESRVGGISTKARKMAKHVDKYLDGYKTDLNSHGR